MPTTEFAVVTEGLTKHFGDLVAVDHVDLEIPTGTVAALLGPNGAGKTTMVRMLATLARPTSGSGRVCGHDIVEEPDAVRAALALTGQFAALEPNLTPRENLILIARLRGHGRQAATRIVDELVDRFDIGEFAGTPIKSVSGGQRRRADLAASLVTEPQLLVLDEPTTGLDPRSRQVVWSTVRELVARGVTVVLTTQYLEEADQLAHRVAVLDGGRIVAEGTLAELKARIPGGHIELAFADRAELDAAAMVLAPAGRDDDALTLQLAADGRVSTLRTLLRQLDDASVEVEALTVHTPDLDDVFFALTGKKGA